MTLPSRITDEARNIMDEACLPEAMVKNGTDAALRSRIAKALLAAEQRGREMERPEVLVWHKARMRAVFIQMIDKLPEEAVTALTDAMNAVSDEMEAAAAIRSRTTEG